MVSVVDTISYDNEVFRAFVFWSTIMCVKMLAMSILTGKQRFSTKTFANPEDIKPSSKGLKPKFDDPDVERVRRAHRNDLENIIVFIIVGFFYALTAPQAYLAVNLIRAAAISRIVHTFVYAIYPMQPARALAWFVCYGITGYMAVQVLYFFV